MIVTQSEIDRELRENPCCMGDRTYLAYRLARDKKIIQQRLRREGRAW